MNDTSLMSKVVCAYSSANATYKAFFAQFARFRSITAA
jgi:hypothetical protein